MKRVTVYREDSVSQVVYPFVKHVFWTANGTVLTIAVIDDVDTGAHHYVNWLREKLAWYRETPHRGPAMTDHLGLSGDWR